MYILLWVLTSHHVFSKENCPHNLDTNSNKPTKKYEKIGEI